MNTSSLYGVSGLLLLVLKGGVILSLAALAALALRNASAAARHCVWFLGMAGALALPLFDALTPRWMVEVPAQVVRLIPGDVLSRLPNADLVTTGSPGAIDVTRLEGSQSSADEASPSDGRIPGSAASGGSILVSSDAAFPPPMLSTAPAPTSVLPRSPAAPFARWTFTQVMTVALAVWALGSALLLVTFVVGLVTLARLGLRSIAFPEGRVRALTRSLALEMGMREAVPVLQGAPGAMPMSWGLVRRVILLPKDAEGWDEARLVAVLRHELAHVRRRDCLTQAVAEISLALHWPNPLAWLAARRLRVEREHACDDAVVLAGARPSEYALALMDLAASSPLPRRLRVAAAMARPVHLRGRLRAILDERRVRKGSRVGNSVAAVTAIVLVGAVAAFTPAAESDATAHPQGRADTKAGAADSAQRLGRSNGLHMALQFFRYADRYTIRGGDLVPLMRPSILLRYPEDALFREVARTTIEASSASLTFSVTVDGAKKPEVSPRENSVVAPTEVPRVEVELGQIRGRITDASTGALLRDAQVRRVGSDVVALSSESGAYALIDVAAGTYELRVELVGYATQTRQVALTQEAVLETDFALMPAANLQELFEIELERLRKQYNTTIPDPPEVVITGTAGSSQRVSSDSVTIGLPTRIRIRGAQNLPQPAPIIYIDGVRMSPPPSGSVLDQLSPDQIERIEIIKGPAAVERYGPEAESGVILIFLKRPPQEAAVLRPPVPDLDSIVASMSIRIRMMVEPYEDSFVEPLVFVDGLRLEGETRSLLRNLNREQIERIEVMKGVLAVQRYGPEAQRGAILVFLKR